MNIELESLCFDITKDKNQKRLAKDEIAVTAVNHANQTIMMILKRDQIQKLLAK